MANTDYDVLSKSFTTSRFSSADDPHKTVIGSGPIGATFAREILEPLGTTINGNENRIAMVESGAQ